MNPNTWFNSKPYWLKGGILIFPVLILLIIFFGLLLALINGGKCSLGVCLEMYPDYCPESFIACFGIPLSIALTPLNLPFIKFVFREIPLIMFIYLPLFYFIIGAFVGWIYGKIKSKNK